MIPCSSCILFSQWMFTRLCHDRFHMGSPFPCVQHQKIVSDVPYLLHHKEGGRGCASLSGKEVNLRGWHWAVSIRRVRGVRERLFAPESGGHGGTPPGVARPQVPEVKEHLDSALRYSLHFSVPLWSLWVTSNQNVLWFCEKEICYAWPRTGSQKMSFTCLLSWKNC